MITYKNAIAGMLIAGVTMLSPLLLQTTRAQNNGNQDAEVTFTKWITGVTPSIVPGTPLPPGDPGQNIILMAGFTGGDAPGVFSGDVIYRKVSANGRITQLWPIYEVSAGSRSFTALIQGGTNNRTGVAMMDGVVMDGWRVGDRVQVTFQAMTNCAGAPAGPCFQGTIRISRDKNKS
jgi:hypothetical protein